VLIAYDNECCKLLEKRDDTLSPVAVDPSGEGGTYRETG